MKNTWLHSSLLILIAAPLLAVAAALRVADSTSALAAPSLALSLLAPGLVLGWFSRRHPLVVGAVAGIAVPSLAQALRLVHHAPASLLGEALFSAMIVAVAALAGRALRFRFSPGGSFQRSAGT